MDVRISYIIFSTQIVIEMNYRSILILLVFFLQCKISKNTQPRICDQLDLTTAKIGEISFVSYYPELLEELGSPILRLDSCASTSILYKQGFHHYDCLEFEKLSGVRFNLYKDTIFVSSVDFSLIEVPIIIEGLEMSNETLLSEIIQDCTSLAQRLNKGVSSAQFEGQDWIYIKESTDIRHKGRKNELELRFENKKLIKLFYDWQPSYNLKEWNNYLITKKELDK